MRSKLGGLALAAGATWAGLLLGAGTAQATTPTYSNGFETDTAGWLTLPYSDSDAFANTIDGTTGAVAREPSGYTNGGAYASGISSSTGSYHGRLQRGGCSVTGTNGSYASECTADLTGCYLESTGGGPAPLCYGPFTRWGGYNSGFPAGGWTTQVDIYLDVEWGKAHPDSRFDYSSAVTSSSGGFLRDFVFNAGTDANGFVISASPNAFRDSTYPANPGKDPVHITTSGWYTFRHHFYANGTNLAVDMDIFDSGGNVVKSWTLPRPSPDPANEPATPIADVGCNRYGWFANQEIPDLPIDNASMTGCGTPPAGSLDVTKFYDANANGIKDAGEQNVSDWKVKVSDGNAANDLIGLTPYTASELAPNNYAVSEFAPQQSNWTATTSTSVSKAVAAGSSGSVAFGNVCTGAGGAMSIGYWASKSATSLITAANLTLLSGLHLRNTDGSNFDPTTVRSLQSWLAKATATNMAYMLSAQLAGMELNVSHGKIGGSALVYAPGANSANAAGFATISALTAEADAELAVHGLTRSGSPYRAYQERLKTALERANTNLSFAQQNPCPFSFAG